MLQPTNATALLATTVLARVTVTAMTVLPGSLCVNSQTGLFQYYYRNSTTLTITGSLGIGPGPGPAYLIDSKTWIIIGTTFPLLHGQETGINAVESGKHGEPAATMGLGSGSVQTSLNCSPTTGLSYSQ